MNIILQFYPRWNTSSGSSATRWRCSDARAPPWYRREPESSRYKVCPKTVWRPIWSNLSLSRIHTLAVYHSSLIGRVSPTTPSNQPRHPPTNQPTTNKTCPSTGGERTEFDKYKYTIPSTFSLSNNPKYTLQSFVAVGDQQHASLCAAYHPAWMDDPRTRTIHTRSWKHGEGEGEEGEGKKKKTKRRACTRESGGGNNRFASTRRKKRSRSLTTLASWYKSGRKRRKRREHAPRREEKDEPVPTEVSSKLTGPWLLWASECLARGPGFRYPGQPQQERGPSGGGNKKVSLERT